MEGTNDTVEGAIGSSRATPDTSPAEEKPVPPEIVELQNKIAQQGELVRKLKAEKSEQTDEAIQELLRLKALLPEEYQPKKNEGDGKKKKKGGMSEAQAARQAKKEAARLARMQEGQKKTEKVLTDTYGDIPMPQSRASDKTGRKWTRVREIDERLEDMQVWIRGYAHTVRAQSRNTFLVVRQTSSTIQVVALEKKMAKWAGNIVPESIVDVCGKVVKVDTPTNATQNTVEIAAEKLFVVDRADPNPPFQVVDAARSLEETEKLSAEGKVVVSVDFNHRLDHRCLDLRTPASQAIMRISSAVCSYFREYLTRNEFVEIQTPKLLGGSSEGGAEVFKTDYFGKPCTLAQSPQLHKQMCAACSGFERVFEIGPVFRAEFSDTNRHLCEFHGLDIEMAFFEHYHEVLDVFSDMFSYIFDRLNEECKYEIEAVRHYFPFEDLIYRAPDSIPKEKISGTTGRTLRIEFQEAISLLRAAGVGPDEQADYDDLSTPVEKKLGELVREKYGVDFYFLDQFPLEPRPFYTMPSPHNDKLSNSYDFFIRGQEILSGAQRVHIPDVLTERIEAKGIPVESLKFYIDSFRYGAMPHAGGGIGLERVVMLFLGLPNIRLATFFTRDPFRLAP